MSDPLIAVELTAWVDPASVHGALYAADDHSFWLDAGPDAGTGWSWVGAGAAESVPERVRGIACQESAAPPWPAGPFRGGWVGWLGYDDAAARAGAPARFDERMPRQAWLRVTRFVAFDHGARRVWAIGPAGEEAPVLDAIITLSHRLGLAVVAEGVETPYQFDYLKARGVAFIQGYLFARPMPSAEFVRWYAGHEQPGAAA